jgi:uncharacterized protein
MLLSRPVRRLTAVALLAALPLLAACGGSNNNTNNPTPTATQARPTSTATQAATSTATAVPSETATQAPTSTATIGVPTSTATEAPTSTATEAPTFTATEAPTSTPTNPPATLTATPTGIPTGTATATATPTGIPTGTATATATPTGIPTGTSAATATPTPTPLPTVSAHGSVEQVYVIDAAPGAAIDLYDPDSQLVMTGTADAMGSLIFRNVAVGQGYVVSVDGVPSDPIDVTAPDAPPDHSFYEHQVINPGYGYLETRDGTLLAVNVSLPGPVDQGPYPTVIEYSGYDPANPDSPQPSTLIADVLGYATVGINMRGTGCSGGAFQFFETLQDTDGYDAIEAIAAQPWVKDHRVGMVGLSYPGISQLFVAQYQPPSLEAIAPLSVIADTGRGTLYPGGILNNGFATDWAAERQHDATVGGQPWSQKRIDAGDQVCIANQKLRDQTPDIFQMIDDNMFYVPAVADPVSPATFVHNITVPVFLAGAAQDEQTGGYFATMLDRFTGTDKLHFTLVNGNHTEPLIPQIFARWMEFLSFYVRKEVPKTTAAANLIVGALGDQIFTSPGLTLPPDRFTGKSYDEALAQFEAEPKVRVLFDNGAGGPEPGAPGAAFEHSFDAWPIPQLQPTTFYFGEHGTLTPDPPTDDGVDSYRYDSSHAQDTTYTGGGDGIWARLPPWHWLGLGTGTAVAYATEPLQDDMVMAGSGSVDLWLQAENADDVDLQVTLSEIRPDGMETYIISGWLRASHRKLDEDFSTVLRPVQTHAEADAAPLPPGEFSLARVELFPFAHAFRAGSRIRLTVEAPGGDRPLWKFRALEPVGEVTVDVARSPDHPSKVVLPVVPGIDIPTELPPCPSLRGEPCRPYVDPNSN